MKLLILGGTILVGRHIVQSALAAGHDVTLFNRGQTNAHLFPEVEKLRGDRDNRVGEGLRALRGHRWDAVVDVNGYVPRHVHDSATLLADAVDHYIYVSTGAVYQKPFPTNGDESVPVETIEDPASENVDAHYGALKALSERAAKEAMPERTLTLRLGLVSGPHDDSDRVTYWVDRVAKGGEILVPNRPDAAFQTIDVRDFSAFVMQALDGRYTGTLNTTGPSVTWKKWLDTCLAVSGGNATFTWIDDHDFLVAERPSEARPFGSFPMLLPPDWGDWWTNNSDKAQSLGLTYRPIEDTIRDILEWVGSRPPDWKWMAGLSCQQEQLILKKWHVRQYT